MAASWQMPHQVHRRHRHDVYGVRVPPISDTEEPETEVWLVRHGETEWSRSGRHTSSTDLPLTAEGERVALGLKDRLEAVAFDLVLTSPMQRARETAALVGHADAEVDGDLVEWGYGEYEGRTSAEIRETDPEWTIWTRPTPGGETPAQVSERLDRVVERLRDVPERALVFGHGHSLRALTARWLELPVTDGRLFRLDTATLSKLGYERETAVILAWNS
jgi:probable phosphoglycerate mutase